MSSLAHFSTTNSPTDPILRLLQSLDDNDPVLLTSSLYPACTLDQSGLSAITGHPLPTLTGHSAIVTALLDHGVGANMDTGHFASNFRVTPTGEGDDEAEVSCYTIGSHYRKGEGLQMDKKGFVAGNRWRVEVVKGEDRRWRIRKAGLRVLWVEGDASVMGVLMPKEDA